MLGAFDGAGAVEVTIREAVLQPVAKTNRNPGRAPGCRDAELAFGDCHAFEKDPISRRKQPRRFTIAAADIADGHSGLQIEPFSHQLCERIRRFRAGFLARLPITMVDVVSPDFPVEGIELIIVKRDSRAGLVDLWPDH